MSSGSRTVGFYFNDNGRTFHPLEFGDNKGTAYGIATGDVDEDGVMDR